MNNENTVKIGVALKWRGTFDMAKKYYQDNVVTYRGCVFRCKALSAQGISPVTLGDELTYIEYLNPDVWDVVVDYAFYYNFVIDCNRKIDEIQKHLKVLDEITDRHTKEIAAIQEDDLLQWEHITALEENAKELQRQIDEIVKKFEAHEKAQKAYEAANDAKIAALGMDIHPVIQLTPEIIYANSTTTVDIDVSVDLPDAIDSLKVFVGENEVYSGKDKVVNVHYPANLTVSTVVRAEVVYKGMKRFAEKTIFAHNPIYLGFSDTAANLTSATNRLTERCSAEGYFDRSYYSASPRRFFILVPNSIEEEYEVTTGGVVMEGAWSNQTITGKPYRCFTSTAQYSNPGQIRVTLRKYTS